jgi:PAS domain S-box-containing protein
MAKRKPAAPALPIRAEALLQMLAEGVDEVLWFSTFAPEKVLFVSPAFEQVWGRKAAELYAQPRLWTEAILEEDRDAMYRAYLDWIEGRAARFDVEFRIRRHSDGQVRWISDRGEFIREFDGLTVVGGIAEDITEWRQLEQERAELMHRLKDALSIRDEFISLASHELRTPLVPLKLSLQTINRLTNLEKGPSFGVLGRLDFQRLLSTAMEQVLRMEVLTNNLLDASSLQAGKLEIHRQETNLSALLQGIIASHRHWVESSGSTLEVRIQPDVIGEFDPMRVEQIIVNLISNALKYAPGTLIEIELEQLDGTARLIVRDHGPGIPSEFMPRLFDRFARSEKNKKKQGIGLGLYLSRQIAEAHGGRISARQATTGSGAEFELIVPVREREERHPPELKAG